MPQLLFAWIGFKDRDAAKGGAQAGLGPIGQAAEALEFDEFHLLSDFEEAESEAYAAWLRDRVSGTVVLHPAKLSGPTRHKEIYEAVVSIVGAVIADRDPKPELTFHLSPGTPAMHAVWLMVAKTRFAAKLIESSRDHGVEAVSVPFDISAELVPELVDARLVELAAGAAPSLAGFDDIHHRSREMKRVLERAARVAPFTKVPVLIEGESGTGKELMARAIHNASKRPGKFVAVNCGAIPENLVEAVLFGHEAGAFTGALGKRLGVFETASGGTLFLDELGELPLDAQVKLLRVLQEQEITRLGKAEPIKVDVRVIAATNKPMLGQVAAGEFREDLFFRLAVAVIRLPPLRERKGDIGLLVDHLLAQINDENKTEFGGEHKKLSAAAKSLLLAHTWPGNVRELLATLRRAAIWSSGDTISVDEMRDALLPSSRAGSDGVLDRPLGEGLNIEEILNGVARHYLERAMDESGGVKTQAAKLVGLPSYQTLTNWLRKYGVGS